MAASEQVNRPLAKCLVHRTLRWWPAAFLVVAMVLLRKLPDTMEAPSLPVFMLGFMGPAGLGLLIMLWWLFASRAHWKEKLIGFVAVAIIGFVAISLCHFTMQGMSVVIFLIPFGTAAFAIPLILFANRPSIRLPVALISAVIGFGYWDLLQSGGVSGKFVADFSWRWESTAEEKYLKSLANEVPAKPVETNVAPITLATAVWPNFRGSSRDGKLVGVSLIEDWIASPPKLIWKTPIGPGWSSFSVAGDRFDSVSGVLMETNAGLQFVNAIDGKKIWQFDSPSKNYRTLQPLVLGNSVLLANSMGEGTKRLSVSLNGDQWSIKEEWASRDMKPDFNDFVEHKGSLYGFDGNIFSCIDLATGKRQWKKGRYGNGQVLMLCDAGQMLVTSETGELVLLRADSTSMKELGKFQAIEGKTWNHSVVVGNRVYIRNAEQAACYELPTQ